MKNIELGIEISEDVLKSKTPNKIVRYDLVPQKVEKKAEKKSVREMFYDYKPEMAKYWIRGKK